MDRMNFDIVPPSLRRSNPLFANHMQTILPSSSRLKALRQVALLVHKMMTIDMVHELWIVYRKSGTGELPSPVSAYRGDLQVWITEVPSLTPQLVAHCLNDLSEQHQQCQRELSAKTQAMPGYTRIIEYTLAKFVKQGLKSFRMDIDRQIASVRYQYNDAILQRAYLAAKPNDHQVSLSSRSNHEVLDIEL